jgi:hypothetical protein
MKLSMHKVLRLTEQCDNSVQLKVAGQPERTGNGGMFEYGQARAVHMDRESTY